MSDPDASDLVSQLVETLTPGCFVTKFVLVAEVIDTEGDRSIWSENNDDATRWDIAGLLTELLGMQAAEQAAEAMRDCE